MIKKIAIIALIAWAFQAGLNRIEITPATTVQNTAAASQLAALER